MEQFGPTLTPMLMDFLEEYGRVVQEKVSEEVNETKGDLKQSLPGHVDEYVKSDEAHPMAKQAASVMGDSFTERVKSLTGHTVDAASEGMDLLLTGGVINIARDILSKVTEGKSMAELEILKSDKENMIKHTLAAAIPIIKQVSKNIGHKISEHLPASIGGHIQEWIDEHGGDHGIVGLAAGLMGKLMGGDDDDSDDDDPPETRAAKKVALEKAGIRTGKLQRIVTSILGPKISEFIVPHMQKFEEKMHTSLEGELRTKVFSFDYIKKKALSMLTQGGGALGALAGVLMGGSGGKGKDKGDGSDDEGDSNPMSAILGALSGGGAGEGGGGSKRAMFGALAGQFLKKGDDDD
ncbi:hypothetical protein BGZ65_006730 [Modicella reniformis]|uniref:Uncharacterized protein n=1 Tax=Modicella reniformis TaxID=1440133 RepID=A0A9P6M8C3_9FUNG|nr:hypothetical protein BGZ65_006730 [Modicella reniformis]